MSKAVQAQVKAPPVIKLVSLSTQSGLLQRKCACGGSPGLDGECAECRAKRLSVQRRAATPASSQGVPPIVYEVLGTPGKPLDAGTRAFIEPRFGHDFSNVRVHTDAKAAESARAVSALAYTVGRDVVFGTGQYAPETMEGKRLLAHELTHTIQQGAGIRWVPDKLGTTSSGDTAEQEAELAAQSIVRGQSFSPTSNDSLKIARQDSPTVSGSSPIVYMCSKSLETSPIGTHAFFRVGGSGSGKPTYGLEPQDNRPLSFIDGESRHSGCWQGVPVRDFPEDFNATKATCEATAISLSCLEAQFAAYPIGQYCTYGPNSNTLVGHIARHCGLSNPDPAGWNPGIDDNPPSAGTFAPSPMWTTTGCELESCPTLAPDQGRPRAGVSASA